MLRLGGRCGAKARRMCFSFEMVGDFVRGEELEQSKAGGTSLGVCDGYSLSELEVKFVVQRFELRIRQVF